MKGFAAAQHRHDMAEPETNIRQELIDRECEELWSDAGFIHDLICEGHCDPSPKLAAMLVALSPEYATMQQLKEIFTLLLDGCKPYIKSQAEDIVDERIYERDEP